MARSTARSALAENAWLGRLWQSVQSITRCTPAATWASVTPGLRHSRTEPSAVVIFTYWMSSRVASVDTNSMRFCTFMCQWMPSPTPVTWLPPPTFTSSVVTVSLAASSSAYSLTTRSLLPWIFSGQWHVPQVSRAGRRSATGVGMGRW